MNIIKRDALVSLLNRVMRQEGKLTSETEVTYICKFHTAVNNVDRRKFGIDLETQEYNCFACGTKGKSIKSLLKRLKCDSKFFIELSNITQDMKDGVFINEKPFERRIDKSLPREFIPLYNSSKSIHYKNAMKYIKRRGISIEDLYRYNIGYCEEGKYVNRIIFPSYDESGELNFFTGRDFYETSSLRYLNCDFDRNLIGFESMIDFTDEITLVEGPIDAITVKRNCIPLFGKFLSEKLKIELSKCRPSIVNVMLDNDAERDSVKICEFLINNGIKTKRIELDTKDANVLGFEKTWHKIDSSIILSSSDLFKMKFGMKL